MAYSPLRRCQTASRSIPIIRSSHGTRPISSTSTTIKYVPTRPVTRPAAVSHGPRPCDAGRRGVVPPHVNDARGTEGHHRGHQALPCRLGQA